MATRQEVIEHALSYEGVRWIHVGRSREHGVDCGGLIILTGQHFGMLGDDCPDNYPRRPNGTFVSLFQERMDQIKVSEAVPGDVLLFNDNLHPCHCGIMAEKWGKPSVIHAHALRRRVMHETLEEAQSVVGRPHFAFKYRGIED